MPRKKFARLEKLLFLSPLLMLGAAWGLQNWPQSWKPSYRKEKNWEGGCQYTLKSIAISVRQYAADYDGRFPPAKGRPGAVGIKPSTFTQDNFAFSGEPRGWADSLLVYLKSTTVYQCNSEPNKSYIDYFFNSNLSTLPKSKLAFPTSTLLLGDGNNDKVLWDYSYSLTSLPPNWLTDLNSPAFRHLGGANYLMADGSVHWLKPDQLATFGAGKDLFAIK